MLVGKSEQMVCRLCIVCTLPVIVTFSFVRCIKAVQLVTKFANLQPGSTVMTTNPAGVLCRQHSMVLDTVVCAACLCTAVGMSVLLQVVT